MSRDELVAAFLAAGREISDAAVMFHTALAERLGLSPTEMKAAGYLQQHGPITAGRLAQLSGLAPASVTALVDRLVRKGFAQRVPDAQDRRKVYIELRQQAMSDATVFDGLMASMTAMCERYSDEQLALVIGAFTEAARRQHAETERLTAPPPQ